MKPQRIAAAAEVYLGLALAMALHAWPAWATDPGIYLEDTAAKTETAVVGTMTMDFKSRSVGASMATFGLVKPKTVFTFEGARAELRLPAQPAFRFHFGPKRDAHAMQDPTEMMNMMSGAGMPFGAGKPEDFSLVALTVNGEGREIVLVQKRAQVQPTNPTFAFSVEKLGEADFRVRPKAPLPPGEYGFFCGASGSMPEIWAFGVN